MKTATTIAMITAMMMTSVTITAPILPGDNSLLLDVLPSSASLIPELDGFSVSGLIGEVLSSEFLVEVTLGTSGTGGTGIAVVD